MKANTNINSSFNPPQHMTVIEIQMQTLRTSIRELTLQKETVTHIETKAELHV